jgi:hypothetical protein
MGSDHKHRVCTFQEAGNAIKAHEKACVNGCFRRGPGWAGEAAWECACPEEALTMVAR